MKNGSHGSGSVSLLSIQDIEETDVIGAMEGVTQFGDPSLPGGALIVVNGQNPIAGIKAGMVAEMVFEFKKNRVPILPELSCLIHYLADVRSKEFLQKQRSKGVPSKSKALFSITKKKEAVKYCNMITMLGAELSNTISNCDQLGYKHTRFHHQYIPPELIITQEEHLAMQENGVGSLKSDAAQRFVRKTQAMFKKRKNLSAHLFEKGGEWHMMWFTYDDMDAGAKGNAPHWVEGNHIHYTSYLWGLEKDKIWSSIKKPSYHIPGVHIRYKED